MNEHRLSPAPKNHPKAHTTTSTDWTQARTTTGGREAKEHLCWMHATPPATDTPSEDDRSTTTTGAHHTTKYRQEEAATDHCPLGTRPQLPEVNFMALSRRPPSHRCRHGRGPRRPPPPTTPSQTLTSRAGREEDKPGDNTVKPSPSKHDEGGEGPNAGASSPTAPGGRDQEQKPPCPLLTVNFRQPSYEFTFNVGIDLLF
jgi:hypothetical protein